MAQQIECLPAETGGQWFKSAQDAKLFFPFPGLFNANKFVQNDNNKEKGFLAILLQAKKGLSKLIMGDIKLKPLLQTKVEE